MSKINEGTETSPSGVALPEHVGAVDAVLTEKLLASYTDGTPPGDRTHVADWEPGNSSVAGHAESTAVRAWLADLGGSGL